MANISFKRLGVSMAVIARASTRGGTARKTSVRPHDRRLDPRPAVIAGEEAQDDARRDPQAEDDDPEEEREAVSEDHPSEDVSADPVGSEEVLEARRLPCVLEVGVRIRLGRDRA